jgi:class 3 adenylate cyclase
MGANKQATVLFAKVSGGDELSLAAGTTAGLTGISRCISRIRRTAEASGGRVVKVFGSEVMMVFDSPDKAAGAASRMHTAVDALPPVAGTKLAVKVGYHAGPVVEAGDDLLGDTVKLAAALVHQARRGQTMTTQQTAEMLSKSSRAYSTQVYAVPLAGNAAKTGLSRSPSHAQVRLYLPRATSMLRLNYGREVAVCWRENETVVVGRNRGCGLVIAHSFASRRHCTIRLREDGFTIRDHSSNGTYLTNEGTEEILLRNGDEAPLATHGWVGFGRSRTLVSNVLEFTGH